MTIGAVSETPGALSSDGLMVAIVTPSITPLYRTFLPSASSALVERAMIGAGFATTASTLVLIVVVLFAISASSETAELMASSVAFEPC